MKNPNQKLLNRYTFNMIAFLDGAKVVDRNKHVIHLDGKFYHAEVRFYLGKIAEFTAEDRKSREIIYYLHFEMTDFDTINRHLNSFVYFLQVYRSGSNVPSGRREKQQVESLKILISCSSGITSSYFAHLMQEKALQIDDRIRVEAADYMRVDSIQENFDYILLAPQISHKLAEFQKKYGENRVMGMDIIDFASRNVDSVLEKVLKRHQGDQKRIFFRRLRKTEKDCMIKI